MGQQHTVDSLMKELILLNKQSEVLKELLSKKPKEGIVIVTVGSYGHIMDINGNFKGEAINKAAFECVEKISKTLKVHNDSLAYRDSHIKSLKEVIEDLKKRNESLVKKKRSWW